jgi:death-on-curing protein
MEAAGRSIAYPTLKQIVDVNRQMINTSGGSFLEPDNFTNRGSLEYILAAVSASLFGHEIFPSIKDKASAIAFEIISAHVFRDGNKRTGVHVAWEFLAANRIDLRLDETIVDLTVRVADGEADRGDLLRWLHAHQ